MAALTPLLAVTSGAGFGWLLTGRSDRIARPRMMWAAAIMLAMALRLLLWSLEPTGVPALVYAMPIDAGVAFAAVAALRGHRTPRRLECDYTRRIAPLGQGPADPVGPRSHVKRAR